MSDLDTDSPEAIAAQDAAVALNPIVGIAREDILSAVTMLLRETVGAPQRTMRLWGDMASDAFDILAQRSDVAPDPKDKRFQDPAWAANPFAKMGLQYYLSAQERVGEWLAGLDVVEIERARASFVTQMIMSALAPTNVLATNPSAIKKAIETGGGSLLKGLANAYDDLVHNDMIVSQVDRRPFTVGENLAVQPGAVVHRTEMMELLHYAPTTAEVHAVPLLIIPPQINKAYINDLTASKSVVKFLLDHGIQVFLVSWRNPQAEHRSWGLIDYVDELIVAIDAVRTITGSDQVSVSGACSGGITTATLLSKLKAHGRDVIRSATFKVCVLDPAREDTEVGALVSRHGVALARERSAKKGVLEGTSLSRMFAWLRPNDLVWNYVINNYLHGEDPPAFDILFWNNDSTNLTAALHSDYLRLYEERLFAEPGRHELAGHKVDLTAVEADLFILAGVTDHITPWKACYRSVGLFGSKNIEFILSQAGHIQAILNPPGNPKAKYHRLEGSLPDSAEDWSAQAQPIAGSWWPHWAEWLKTRSGEMKVAAGPGSPTFPALDPAPGRYVHD